MPKIVEFSAQRGIEYKGPVPLHYKKLHPSAITPRYAHPTDSGMDLFCPEKVCVPAGKVVLIKTGIAFDIHPDYEIQIRLRSGASMQYPLIMPNAPATIDSGYRGDVGIIVRNLSLSQDVYLEQGERIAQAVLCPVRRADLIEVTGDLSSTDRGVTGYGQSGQF